LVHRASSTPVAWWSWPTSVVSRRRVLEVVFILLEPPPPLRRIFIGSHSLPSLWFAVSVLHIAHLPVPWLQNGRRALPSRANAPVRPRLAPPSVSIGVPSPSSVLLLQPVPTNRLNTFPRTRGSLSHCTLPGIAPPSSAS
jgi:hypothetical protein